MDDFEIFFATFIRREAIVGHEAYGKIVNRFASLVPSNANDYHSSGLVGANFLEKNNLI